MGTDSDIHQMIIQAPKASTLLAPGEMKSAGNVSRRITKRRGPRINPIWRPENRSLFTQRLFRSVSKLRYLTACSKVQNNPSNGYKPGIKVFGCYFRSESYFGPLPYTLAPPFVTFLGGWLVNNNETTKHGLVELKVKIVKIIFDLARLSGHKHKGSQWTWPCK